MLCQQMQVLDTWRNADLTDTSKVRLQVRELVAKKLELKGKINNRGLPRSILDPVMEIPLAEKDKSIENLQQIPEEIVSKVLLVFQDREKMESDLMADKQYTYLENFPSLKKMCITCDRQKQFDELIEIVLFKIEQVQKKEISQEQCSDRFCKANW